MEDECQTQWKKNREREKEKVYVSQTPCTKQAPIPKRWIL